MSWNDCYKNNNKGYASYSTFYIGGSTTDYNLHVSGYSVTARDSVKYYNLMKFTTKDNDNDAGNWHSSVIVQLNLLVHGGIITVITLT